MEKGKKEEEKYGIPFLKEKYPFFKDENFQETEKNVTIKFSDDFQETYSLEELGDLVVDLKHLKIIDNGRFCFTWLHYQIVKIDNENIPENLFEKIDLSCDIEKEDRLVGKIRIIQGNPIARFLALELGVYESYNERFYLESPVIEIEYHDKRGKLSLEDETNLINSFLFEIIDSTGIRVFIDEFSKEDGLDHVEINLKEDPKLRPLMPFNEGMHLFISAIQITDESLRFLNFYKIIEFFSPIVIKKEANSLLASQLDNPKALDPDREYLENLFNLVISVNDQYRDSELTKTVLQTIDIIDSIKFLPIRLKKRALGIAKIKDIDYTTPKEKVSIFINVLGSSLYSTRNFVVHAKSNYQLKGDECKIEELHDLNLFMREITAKLIRWYNRLPKHQK